MYLYRKPWCEMDHENLRAQIVAEARTWLWTPFVHRGMVKGDGVDCAMLCYAVYRSCGLMDGPPPRDYAPDWFQHREDQWLLDELLTHGMVEVNRDPWPGDIVIYKVAKVFAHCVIATDWPRVVEAWPGLQYVAEIDISIENMWSWRDKKVLTLCPQ